MSFQPVTQNILRMEVEAEAPGMMSTKVNLWLVAAEGGWTLIDSGPPQTGNQVVAALSAATQGDGPSQVLLTHGHLNHVGGLHAINIAWKSPVICHQDEQPYVSGAIDYRDAPSKGIVYMISKYLMPSTPGVKVMRTCQGGETVAGMIVIHLSGHTPGHIGLLHPRDQAMICGDALVKRGERLTPPSVLSTVDPKQAQASIQRMSELDFVHLLPSHGEPILQEGHRQLREFLGFTPQDDIIEPW